MSRTTFLTKRVLPRLTSLLFLTFILPASANESADYDDGHVFGNHSMRGNYSFAIHGSFSSAPPPFMGTRENFAFSQVGLYYFDGFGNVNGEFSLAFQNATSGGNYSTATEVGTYTVSEDGRMIVQFEDFRGDFPINTVILDCVIVRQRKLARCAMVELISLQQGPLPVPLPVTGLGVFERQR